MGEVVTSEALADFSRGLTAQRAGDGGTAVAAFQRAVAADPRLAPAHFNLGLLYRERGEFAAAAQSFAAATELRPNAADGWLNLGLCEEYLGHLDRAAECYHRTLSLDARSAAAYFNLGNVERKRDRRMAAAAAFEAARRLAPDAPEVLLNLGNLLRELGEPARAVEVLRVCRALRPDSHEAGWNLSLALLASGRLDEGWRAYEHRWARIAASPDRGFTVPHWRGESIEGKRILVWREQGLGDELLFATCLPDLQARGAQVVAAVDPRLVGLLGRSFPGIEVIEEAAIATVGFDLHAPIGDLPGILRAARHQFQPNWSYLVPDRSAIATWRERLAGLGSAARVGICWRSGLRDRERGRHYAALADWAPILATEGVQFVNLQYDDCEGELVDVERRLGIRIWRWAETDLRDDLESVAALIWNLDLVITAPTAVSSLAAGLGIETWQLESGNDWTLFGEDRSPWLPALRAFRRERDRLDWQAPVGQVREALVERRGVLATLKGRERS
ncbi:MAG: tetratricopeptide repeat protein [Gemmatimonadales bacterium]